MRRSRNAPISRGRDLIVGYVPTFVPYHAAREAAMTAATTAAETLSLSLRERVALLAGVSAFVALPPDVLNDLAASLTEARVPAGSVVMREGEAGDHLSLIVAGVAEVSTSGPSGAVPLATLGPGEIFGEAALLRESGTRTASVTAVTGLRLLALDRDRFRRVLDAHPDARVVLEATSETRGVANFLKQASPFAALTPEHRLWLAARLRHITVPQCAEIMRQGEPGETCFLLQRGRVEVVRRGDDGVERRLATLGPGPLIGETALITASSRSATVRALEETGLLELRRDDLLAALEAAPAAVGGCLLELVQLRARPRQVPGILVHQRATPEGETVTTLKDPRRGVYYRLSREGLFLWQRLDGEHTLRDLALDYFAAFKAFAPTAISGVIGGLAHAGFLEMPALADEFTARTVRPTRWQRLLLRARWAVTWRMAFEGLDGPITRWYRQCIWILYTRPAQALLGIVAIAGFAAFLRTSGRVNTILHQSNRSMLILLFLIPAYLVSILIHEAGHAFTAKAFGHDVRRGGLGWHLFSPIAYVDTSDMWLAGKWPRIAVALAGPYANVLLGGIAAIAAWRIASPVVAAGLWQFALTSYLGVLSNLNPLVELDGYYVLMDTLERPNLRARALRWLGNRAVPTLRRDGRAALQGHGWDIGYGLAALLFVGVTAVVTVALYRLTVEGWLARVLPRTMAAGLAWIVAIAVIAATVATTVGELRGARKTT